MKVKRMLAIRNDIYERLEAVCKENDYYRNSFMTYVISQNIEEIKAIADDNIRVRDKVKKSRFQIYIDEELYDSIGNSKTHKIEYILDKVLSIYENNNNK